MKALPSLGEQETEILRYVSQAGKISVRDVAEHFEKQKGLARTTILTVMERLRTKGYLDREKLDGVFQYSEKIEAETVVRSQVKDFVQKTLGGSLSPLIQHFAGAKELSGEEINQLRQIIADFDSKKGGKS